MRAPIPALITPSQFLWWCYVGHARRTLFPSDSNGWLGPTGRVGVGKGVTAGSEGQGVRGEGRNRGRCRAGKRGFICTCGKVRVMGRWAGRLDKEDARPEI